MTATEPATCPFTGGKEFDHHSAEYAEHLHETYAELRKECPVLYTPKYGGYYVLSRYEDVRRAAQDDDTFSSEWTHDTARRGISIPAVGKRTGFIETDPPLSTEFRRALMPFFSRQSVLARRPAMERIVDEAIDDVIGRGECDLVKDFADRVPAMTTMSMFDLPTDGWQDFAAMFHHFVSATVEDGAAPREQPQSVWDYIEGKVRERIAAPGDDAISTIIRTEINGEQMPFDVACETVFLLMVAGYDTTAALLSNTLLYLSEHPEERERLRRDPALLESACEEFLRVYTPVLSLARNVTKDVEIAGTTIPAGSRVLLSWASANRDDTVFDEPDSVVLDRFPNRHQSFGLGAHRCLGSFIARHNFVLAVGGFLNRIPDFEIDRSRAVRFESLAANNGWNSLPATFPVGGGPAR